MKQGTRDRINNWARWARGGPARGNGSMTGFICDRMRVASLGELGSSAGTGERLDADDAAVVECAWKRLQPLHRELLRWHYIRGVRPEVICRRFGLKVRPASIFDIELARAEAELGRVLAALAERGPSFETHRAHARGAA